MRLCGATPGCGEGGGDGQAHTAQGSCSTGVQVAGDSSRDRQADRSDLARWASFRLACHLPCLLYVVSGVRVRVYVCVCVCASRTRADRLVPGTRLFGGRGFGGSGSE